MADERPLPDPRPSGDPAALVAGSVDDFLLALADGIHKTQRQLGQLSLTLEPGQPAITYQLPRVDFEFKVAFELATLEGEPGAPPSRSMLLRPAGAGAPARRSGTAEAVSVISGSFVAVPAHGGQSPPAMDVRLHRAGPHTLDIDVHIGTEAGEDLEGVPVEFNLDQALARELNAAAKVEASGLGDTSLDDGLVHSDQRGIAHTTLRVDERVGPGTRVVVIVDALSETETVVLEVSA